MARITLSLVSKLFVAILLIAPIPAHANIGSITEAKGAGTIKRAAKVTPAARGSAIQKNDTVSTNSQGRFRIVFLDKTNVNITENSRLVIDDFVYDGNNKSAGKIGMRLTLGTVKYTSGGIAKGNPKGVGVRTPTATIAVRGTDFVMSVDEAGRSTVVLVPECYDDKDITKINFECPAGEIDVITAAGIVTLNQPFQATLVENGYSPPAPAVTINPAMKGMDNNIQVAPLETDGGQSLIDAARQALKRYTNPAKAAADDNDDPDLGEDNSEETASSVRRQATQQELLEVYEQFNDVESLTETIYTNVSPTFEKNIQNGWVYTRLSDDKQQAVTIFLPRDTDTQIVSSQNGIVDAYNFMDHKWTTSGTGRPQGNITVIQGSGQ